MMDVYREAYECYRAACRNYGIESMDIYRFVKHLTKEQLIQFSKQAN